MGICHFLSSNYWCNQQNDWSCSISTVTWFMYPFIVERIPFFGDFHHNITVYYCMLDRFRTCQKVTIGIEFILQMLIGWHHHRYLAWALWSWYCIVVLCILTNCFLIMKRAWQRIEINDYALLHHLCQQSWNQAGGAYQLRKDAP